MSSLNEGLKKITILEVLIVILALTGILILSEFIGYPLSNDWLYVVVILYFVYRLRVFGDGFKHDWNTVFSKISPKSLVTIVLVNVFFSYGMLYLSFFALNYIPGLDSLVTAFFVPLIPLNSLADAGAMFSTIVISPICEELLFRGVFLNRLNLFVPVSFSIIITSILFGALHSYGSIISAFVFAVCMCIIYIKTKNILTCILAHFLNNLLAEILYHIDTGNLIFTNSIFIVLFSILAVVSFYLIIISIRQEWGYINKR
ncbi:MAG: CPBP family intramembrane metalloprotease [Methanobrevibacter sp.]|uniref:CPBP family intramembrane glutamic endopeptidase n=1 Tax=Methanobrevibacter sp. TaxID=66852 RepID=UPI0025F4AE98|nr:type II CAAX endopeptidase family protein [Methanobrevibacter sp.]MBR0271473.1 CPBP family intramembrane metalloprotease [Methanobrevibacter sp.]